MRSTAGTSGASAKHGTSTKHVASTKHGKRSAKQIAAEKKWQAAGAKAVHVHAVARHAHHAQPRQFTLFGDVSCCSATALAASLSLTGADVSYGDILDLYLATTSDINAGASILQTLEAASRYSLAGFYPEFDLTDMPGDGSVLGRNLPGGNHAITLDGHGFWSWGDWFPASCQFLAGADEAWNISWSRT